MEWGELPVCRDGGRVINDPCVCLSFPHSANYVWHRRRFGRIIDILIDDNLCELRLSFGIGDPADKFDRATRGEIFVPCNAHKFYVRLRKALDTANAKRIADTPGYVELLCTPSREFILQAHSLRHYP